MPPTFVSLCDLAAFNTVDQALTVLQKIEPEKFETKFINQKDGFLTLWPGDASYNAPQQENKTGPYRRLIATQQNWTYLKTSD